MSELESIKEKIIDIQKNPKNNISIIIAIILFIVCIYQTIKTNEISKINSENEEKISNLEKKNSELENKYVKLEEDNSSLIVKYEELESKYSSYVSKVNNYVQSRRNSYYSTPSINSFPSGSYIETRIDGNFEGWEGETIFKMQNGTIWQQASYAYTYHYAYSPKVFIYSKSGGTYMKVDGVDREIRVKRIK